MSKAWKKYQSKKESQEKPKEIKLFQEYPHLPLVHPSTKQIK
ncbi:unnamed protein product [Paramecium octaurelia]|uniref:Uncharacterized protein n=1 Tax=Paramecium octaurelia TaxID=43137 RepID=A0A8S1RYM5_PAROT|nr:unnamed protein product [Paramecium octaurelia]